MGVASTSGVRVEYYVEGGGSVYWMEWSKKKGGGGGGGGSNAEMQHLGKRGYPDVDEREAL